MTPLPRPQCPHQSTSSSIARPPDGHAIDTGTIAEGDPFVLPTIKRTHGADPLFFPRLVATGTNCLAETIRDSDPPRQIILVNQGSNEYVAADPSPFCPPSTLSANPPLYAGHNLRGLPEALGLSVKYFTILRDPRQRIISDFFWYHCGWPHRRKPRDVLPDFFAFVGAAAHLEFYIHHLGPLNFTNRQHFDEAECSRTPHAIAARLARLSLERTFWFVGVTELFDETLARLAAATGITRLDDWHRHPVQSSSAPKFADLPTYARDCIETKMPFDIALYCDYREKFESSK